MHRKTNRQRGGTLRLILPAVAVLLASSPLARTAPRTSHTSTIEAGVRHVLDEQAAAWNRGDVSAFLTGYWNSERTVFAGSQGILHGWEALRERYLRSYPDRKAMGTLTFSDLEITSLCPDAALVFGKWHLDRDAGPIGGVFSLVLRRFRQGWRIIADHTSVVPEGASARGK